MYYGADTTRRQANEKNVLKLYIYADEGEEMYLFSLGFDMFFYYTSKK